MAANIRECDSTLSNIRRSSSATVCMDCLRALIAVLLHSNYVADPLFKKTPVVFTIHNIGYQGLFAPDVLPLLGLPWELFTVNRLEFYGNVNFLKGGLVFADYVTTVSRRYSQEIQTVEYGFGLEGVLRGRSATVTGILNGVDYEEWSPEKDKFIASHFSAENDGTLPLANKPVCKQDLLRESGMQNGQALLPVIGVVSRFAAQKGFDLIAQAADRLAREPMIMLVLGSGDAEYEELFRRLRQQFPGKFAVRIG